MPTREDWAAKLTPAEQPRIRNAADELIFCDNLLTDERAQDAVRDVWALGHHLSRPADGRLAAPPPARR